ncbi:hypothetical protein QMK19_12255 [Streptomyces sp. H10-C2]|uniref:hypothetical protein n=1 Tax=unclassified Streptomyces TaxID=2593676 RepID=UPI0024B88995|nr:MULTISPECIES: hypothetical protein [unclassified Streptomyces]MDJ0341816.1 hypothetical protein [Streptomyces sp. PH10-H1]MDJ0370430.1 hypothetical protein [Streptomyces sp. H10-C2]
MGTTEWTWHSGGAAEETPWRGVRGGTVLHGTDVPVYAALADQWRSAGRMVPGQIDTEWAELVGRIPRLTGV